jgi:hypothetical protein
LQDFGVWRETVGSELFYYAINQQGRDAPFNNRTILLALKNKYDLMVVSFRLVILSVRVWRRFPPKVPEGSVSLVPS